MRTTRVGVMAVGITVLLALGGAPAQAKAPAANGTGPAARLQLRVTPARPAPGERIHVHFVADGRLPRSWRYDVLLGNFGAVSAGGRCYPGTTSHVKGVAARGRVIDFDVWPIAQLHWCPGPFVVTVGGIDVDDHAKVVARRRVTIQADPADPPLENPISISVLDGSTLTIRSPGRKDLVEPVSGRFRGAIPGTPKPNTDTDLRLDTGSLQLAALVPNPFCLGPSYATAFTIAPGSFTRLFKSGHASSKLVLAGDPLALAACAASPPAQRHSCSRVRSERVGC